MPNAKTDKMIFFIIVLFCFSVAKVQFFFIKTKKMRRVYNKFMRRILYLSITKHLEIAVFAMVFVVGLRERYVLVENLFQNRIQAVREFF